jgi:hypothetical protein
MKTIKRKRPLLNFTIDKEVLLKFNEYCKKNCINKSRKLEQLVMNYLEKQNGKK